MRSLLDSQSLQHPWEKFASVLPRSLSSSTDAAAFKGGGSSRSNTSRAIRLKREILSNDAADPPMLRIGFASERSSLRHLVAIDACRRETLDFRRGRDTTRCPSSRSLRQGGDPWERGSGSPVALI